MHCLISNEHSPTSTLAQTDGEGQPLTVSGWVDIGASDDYCSIMCRGQCATGGGDGCGHSGGETGAASSDIGDPHRPRLAG